MNFITIDFLLFLLACWLLFVLVPAAWRKWLLLGASYVFYASWSMAYIMVILLTTTTDFFISRWIQQSTDAVRRKRLLITGLAVNLVVLGIFKYATLLVGTVNEVGLWFNWPPMMTQAMHIILPLGISFYTFEAISYMVDVYRGKEAAKNWWDYNFYIMYFPHLISGPIVRFNQLWPQYQQPIELPSLERVAKGIELIVLGVIFKVFIADPVSTVVDPVFNDPTHASVLTTYITVWAFGLQIYMDFMGYTHIARGVSLLMNIELPLNFNHPYLASSVSDFWHRWHISLSTWIRDYLFIPLGGSRRGTLRTMANLIGVMAIAGLWHGAAWHYVLWGFYHGCLLAAHVGYKWLRNAFLPAKIWTDSSWRWLYTTVSVLLTFWAVNLGWIFFRADSMRSIEWMVLNYLDLPRLVDELSALHLVSIHSWFVLSVVLLCMWLGPWLMRVVASVYRPMPLWLKSATISVVFFLTLIMLQQPVKPFIYFVF